MELVAGGATGPTDEGAGALGLPRLTAAHRVRRELVQPGCERHRQPADDPEQRQRQRDADHGEARPAVPPVSAGLLAAAVVVLGLVAWGVAEVARGVADVAAMRGSAPVAAQLTAAAPVEEVKR